MKSNKSTQQTNQTTSDSSGNVAHEGVVNFVFSGVRKHTSIRMDSNLWKAFKSVCKKNGFSTCDILEKLVLGFLVGVNQMCHKPPTITVVVDAPRVVKRVRRRQLVFEDEVEVETAEVVDFKSKFNFVVDELRRWLELPRYRRDDFRVSYLVRTLVRYLPKARRLASQGNDSELKLLVQEAEELLRSEEVMVHE